ncbi:AMP-binding protein [Desulfatiglans anilini]|uniref:AMP-binding protein n=1 Tax=Desulfatiglans anilini TaxID=90728 RepID=UPI00040C2E59|nr:AMP-binding protein [Desulfatiglans anilini]
MENPFFVPESRPWFRPEAGWPEQVPRNFDFPRISLYQMLAESAAKHADLQAMWFLETFMSYRELDRHVNALATSLHGLGLRKGDVVALVLPNSFQYVISYYACARLGLVVTGVNPTYKPAEVLHQFNVTGVKAAIALDALYEPLIKPIAEVYPLKPVIVTGIVDLVRMSGLKRWLGKKLKKIPTGEVPASAIRFNDLLAVTPAPPDVSVLPDDPATYIMTGGTTGVPKAAVLTHFNCVSNAVQCSLWMWMGGKGFADVGVLPLFHSFAMTTVMNTSVRVGMWMMLFPKPPETGELIKTICRLAPDKQTIYCGAEVLFQRMADYPEIGKFPIARKMRACISGAGPLHRPVQERFEKATNAVIVEGYGLTESSPVISAGPLTDFRTTGTIGLPLPGTEWKIMDIATGTEELPVGEHGELVASGPQVMLGYLNQPKETADTIREWDGKRWLFTGDIGYVDEHGRVTISDRKKQLIKVRGYSVFPKEVEELVGRHESVLEVAASGLPDPETGELIKVWVVLKDNWKGKITESELREWCKENITHYKVPKLIELRDDLPKTLVGKVMRRQLMEADPVYRAFHEKPKA